jgi:ribose transport system ATP-binding protein
LLDELNIDLDPKQLGKELSIAQQQMVEVAKAFSFDSKVIIMDEPTTSLTLSEIDKLFDMINKIRAKGVSVIYISHHLEEIGRIGDRVTVMRDGKTIRTLNVSETDIDELIRLMVGREIKEQYPKHKFNIGKEVLRLEHVENTRVKDVSFTLHKGEILGIAGLMGSGRTEIARAIFGADPHRGSIFVDAEPVDIKQPKDAINRGIAFVTEDRKETGLILKMGVKDNITIGQLDKFTKGSMLQIKKENATAENYVAKLSIRTPSIAQKTLFLSGGNQQKVVIAKWLISQSKIFIFDEPTRGIDVGARYAIYTLMHELVAEGAAIVMISSDLPEILGMSSRILIIHEGRIAGELDAADATQEKVMYYATGGGK